MRRNVQSNYRSRNTFERQFPPQLSAVTSIVSISSALLLFDNRRRSIWRCGVECVAGGAQLIQAITLGIIWSARKCVFMSADERPFSAPKCNLPSRELWSTFSGCDTHKLTHAGAGRSRFSPRPRPNSHFAASRARAHKSRA
jgi:hypothetical protein